MSKTRAEAALALLQACAAIDSIAAESDDPRLAELQRIIAAATEVLRVDHLADARVVKLSKARSRQLLVVDAVRECLHKHNLQPRDSEKLAMRIQPLMSIDCSIASIRRALGSLRRESPAATPAIEKQDKDFTLTL